jgi:surface carbohydrate biosynthesis protein (TIGR04326 family)
MKELYIINSKEEFNSKQTLVWNEKCIKENNILDVFFLIDQNKFFIRNKYLYWIYQIQILKVNKKSIVEHLKIDGNFSFWWMLPLAEKSNFIKSFPANEILKIIALESYLKRNKFKRVITCGLNKSTNVIIAQIATENKISFFKKKEKFFFSLNFATINFLKSFLWLIFYLFKRRNLFRVNLSEWKLTKNKLCIVSYLFNIDLNLLKKQKFSSTYWNHLIKYIHSKHKGINWLNIFFENDEIKNSSDAKLILDQLNKTNPRDLHVTLDAFLSFEVLFISLKTWLNIFFKSFILTKKKIIRIDKKKYFLILGDEFVNNLQNHHLLKNILTYFLMKKAFSEICKQNTCIFVHENQQWEMAFINNFHRYKHNNLIGYQHTTTRFWDLRNFYHSDVYRKDSKTYSYPMPTKLAVHSKLFFKIWIKSKYPKKNIKMVETLRYAKLVNKNLKHNKQTIPVPNKNKINITIVLAAFHNFDQALISCLQKNINFFNDDYNFFLKVQLSSDSTAKIIESNKFRYIDGDLLDIFKVSDLLIISNPSSAVIDAMYTNTPFYIYNGGDFINFSPVYDLIDEKYFIKDYDFIEKLKSFKKKSLNIWNFNKKNILNNNLNIKKWEKIIKF